MKRHRAGCRPSVLASQAVRRAARGQMLEMLEQRQVFNNTLFPLTVGISPTGTLSQNWEDKSLITANADWTGVPSIEGYNGSGLVPAATTTTQSDPQNALGASSGGLAVVPNLLVATGSTGGPAEIAPATPLPATAPNTGGNTVALQGAGSSPAPHLLAYLDTSAVGQVRVQYDLIDIDPGAGGTGATQAFALLYRVGTTGNFINVPSAYISQAADGTANAVGKLTHVNVTLPAAAAGQAHVEVRILTTDAIGSDQYVAVDNIVISGEAAPQSAGAISLSAATFSPAEAAGTFNVTLSRDGGSTGAVDVTYTLAATANASLNATPGDDFSGPGGALTGIVHFDAGQTTATLPITIVQDTLVEGNETFTLTLTNPTGGATLASPSAATLTIVDDDFAGRFYIDTSTPYVVNENAGTVSITVRRVAGSANAVNVNYATTDGTALDGSDYTGTQTGTVAFAAGQTVGFIVVPILNDTVGEVSESFTVTLTGATSGATLSTPASTTVTINDDDTIGQFSFSSPTYSVLEGAGTVTVTVNRINGTTGAVTVDYATMPGTATSPSDFTAKTGTLTFADGVATMDIVIAIVNDTVVEANETFTVVLSNPTNGAQLGATTTTTVTITNDDTAAPQGLLINEVFIDPPSANGAYPFVELKGAPNSILSDVYLILLEGSPGTTQNPGVVDGIFNLSGATIGANGILLIKSGGFSAASGSGSFTPTNNIANAIETDAQSYLLVYRDASTDNTALPVAGNDLDPDNSVDANHLGTLNALPANLTVLDGVGNYDGNATGAVYGVALPSLGNSTDVVAADAIVRFPGNTTALSAGAFYYGLLKDYSGNNTGNQTLTFSTVPAELSANFPSGGIVTPGAINAPTDTTPPTVVSRTFDPRQGQKIVVTFSEDVSASLDATDFVLTNTTTGTAVTLVKGPVSSDGKTITLTFSNTGGTHGGTVLQNGVYQIKVLAGQVKDAANNALAADSISNFTFYNGDFDYDGDVDFDDLVAVAQHYGQSSATYATGDSDYDGDVDFDDLVTVAQNYNKGVVSVVAANAVTAPTPEPAAAPAPAPAPASAAKPKPKAKTSKPATPVVTKKPAPKVMKKPTTFSSAKRIA